MTKAKKWTTHYVKLVYRNKIEGPFWITINRKDLACEVERLESRGYTVDPDVKPLG